MRWLMGWLLAFLQYVGKKRRARWERKAKVEVNARCPACGHSEGKLGLKIVQVENKKAEPCVEHTCSVCSAKWYEPTVLSAEKWFRLPVQTE